MNAVTRHRLLALATVVVIVGAFLPGVSAAATTGAKTASTYTAAATTTTLKAQSAPQRQAVRQVTAAARPGFTVVRGGGESTSAPTPATSTTSQAAQPAAIQGSPTGLVLPIMTNVVAANQPTNRDRPSADFDTTRNVVVDFGGCTSGLSSNCTA